MKKKSVFLAVLAAVLIVSSSIGTAVAYFTTYATAKGGYVITIENRTEIHEKTPKGQKIVDITNTGKGPVFVRVAIFYGSDWIVTPVYDANWDEAAVDGVTYWRYLGVLEPGATTASSLTFNIRQADTTKEWNQGDERNIIVVYESVPAMYTAEGLPDLETAWNVQPPKPLQETITPEPTGEEEP